MKIGRNWIEKMDKDGFVWVISDKRLRETNVKIKQDCGEEWKKGRFLMSFILPIEKEVPA